MFSNLRSLIFKLDPETAHNLAIKSLKFNFVPNIIVEDKNNPLFKTKLFNKDLDNPIGMAAGFDKIDYLDLRDAVHLATSTDASADDRLLVAAWLGETRLIDNCAIGGG